MTAVHAGVGAERLSGGPPGARVSVATWKRAITWAPLHWHLLNSVALFNIIDILEEVQVQTVAIGGLYGVWSLCLLSMQGLRGVNLP